MEALIVGGAHDGQWVDVMPGTAAIDLPISQSAERSWIAERVVFSSRYYSVPPIGGFIFPVYTPDPPDLFDAKRMFYQLLDGYRKAAG